MSYQHRETQKHHALNLSPKTLVIYLLSICQVTLVLSKLSPLGFVKIAKLCFVAKENCCFKSSKKKVSKRGTKAIKLKRICQPDCPTESKPAVTLVNHVSKHYIIWKKSHAA